MPALPYYFVNESERPALAAALLPLFPDKKKIHGMRDAILTVAKQASNHASLTAVPNASISDIPCATAEVVNGRDNGISSQFLSDCIIRSIA